MEPQSPYTSPRPELVGKEPAMLKATLIGGGVAGVVGGLPILGALNCACCALVLAGGFLAAFLQGRDCRSAGVAFRPGSGATVGLVAGLFYAIAHSVIAFLVQLAIPTDYDAILDQLGQADVPPEALEAVERGVALLTGPVGALLTFFLLLLVGAVFSTIGGLIGGAVFKFEPPPPSAEAPPPPAM